MKFIYCIVLLMVTVLQGIVSADSVTPYLHLTVPQILNPANDIWGAKINSDLYKIDLEFSTRKTDIDNLQNKTSGWINSAEYDSINLAVAACNNTTLIVSGAETLTANLNVPPGCVIDMFGSGSIDDGADYTLTFLAGSGFRAPRKQVLIGFSKGDVTFANGTIEAAYPEWGGARSDNSTPSKSGIDLAINAYKDVDFAKGIYKYAGQLSIPGHGNDMHWHGAGSNTTTILFSDSTVDAYVEGTAVGITGLRIVGMQFQGAGKAAGTSIHGIYIHDLIGDSYNIVLDDVLVSYVSGKAIYFPTRPESTSVVFNWRFSEVGTRYVGESGFEGTCGQSCTWINSGNWSIDVDGYCWWFYDGYPDLHDLNAENCGSGLNLGRTAAQGGVEYSIAKLTGMNVEPVKAGGDGIHQEQGSTIASGSMGIKIYAPAAPAQMRSVIYWESLNSVVEIPPVGYIDNDPAPGIQGLTAYVYDGSISAGGSLIIQSTTDYDDGIMMSSGISGKYSGEYVNNSSKIFTKSVTAKGFINTGKIEDNEIVITSADSPYVVNDQTTQHIILVDASGGNVDVSLDPVGGAGNMPHREFLIKRIDTSGNTVTLLTYGGQTIDGVNDPTLAPWKYKRILAVGTSWYIIGEN